ncbi:TetR family transcriptional regulator [Streptomyces sp. NBC_01261]|uniref:TetR/AcrR family transcriptional regulator n=1 Tax=Streptomyces sp. NBC_01261 TaxID=2903802 RepID=UPI002E303B64|nr:TetR family transcriptional regulator [Streptomyces sp. NBC_01261]
MPRTTGQRAGLSRRQVLDAAHHLLAERGLDGLTIRSLAERLDVAPNAVYRWVDNKAALLDALIDDTLACVEVPPDAAAPAEALRSLLLAVFDAICARPALALLYLDRRTSPGPTASAIREHIERLLLDAAVSSRVAATATPVLLVHALGFAAFVQQTEGETGLLHGADMGTARETFTCGLDWLIAGITRDENLVDRS